MHERQTERLQFGQFSVDLYTHELRKDGTRVRLVGQPFEILAVLLSKPGELVTREELRRRLWPGDTFVDFEHGLNAAVNKLRDILSDSPNAPRYIETLPRRGYRFIGSLERQGREPSLAPALRPAPDADHSAQPGGTPAGLRVAANPGFPAAENASPALWNPYLIAAALVLALLIAGIVPLRFLPVRAKTTDSLYAAPQISPFAGTADSSSQPAFSPDGRSIVFARSSTDDEAEGIYVQKLGSNEPVQLTHNRETCCPVWSPDGGSIAFTSFRGGEFGIYVISSSGGAERKLDTKGVPPKEGAIDWSPDGVHIAFSDGVSIFLLPLDRSSLRRLTEPSPASHDRSPNFSQDGKHLLFVRSVESGFAETIMSIPVAGGEPTGIASESARIRGTPRWSADGHFVIFSSERGGTPSLWKVSVEKREPAVEVSDTGSHPAVSARGNMLAYEREARMLSVWQLELLPGANLRQQVLVPLTSQSDQGPGPQYSPDGRRLAYMSDRSGAMEIWTSDRDGKNSLRLSAVGDAGTPRWSADSQSVAFDANQRNGSAIYTIGLQGGTPRRLTEDQFDNRCPAWSRDGEWIYFASHRTGEWQVWKVRAIGGSPIEVTKRGGHAPFESLDGKTLYYAKTAYANPEIWQVPVSGGEESLVSPKLRPTSWASWAVTDKGIIFAETPGKGAPVVNLYDLATRRIKTVGTLETVPFWLTATRDGKTAAFDQPGWHQSQIMLVENFR